MGEKEQISSGPRNQGSLLRMATRIALSAALAYSIALGVEDANNIEYGRPLHVGNNPFQVVGVPVGGFLAFVQSDVS